jgi:hypothetical protein
LIVVDLGHLIVLNPKNSGLLTAAVLSGFIVNPLWFLWVARILWRGESVPAAPVRPAP